MANIPMPKYSGNLEDLDKFERTWNKYVDDSTMGCNEAQRQRLCLYLLPDCVPANVKKKLDGWMEDGKISTWDKMWRTFRKEEVAVPPHHAQRCFKALSLCTLGGHLRVADWRDFRRVYRHPRRYVEHWTEESEAARAAVQMSGEGPSRGAEESSVRDRGQDPPAQAAAPDPAAVDQLLGQRTLLGLHDEERPAADLGGPQDGR